MRRHYSFASGRHIAAARALSGLTPSDLAARARIHRNSLARLEVMEKIGASMSADVIHQALCQLGIVCQTRPVIGVFMG